MIKLLETKSRMVVSRGSREGKRELLFNGYSISVMQDEKIFFIYNNKLYIVTATLHLRVVKIVSVCTFYHKNK